MVEYDFQGTFYNTTKMCHKFIMVYPNFGVVNV